MYFTVFLNRLTIFYFVVQHTELCFGQLNVTYGDTITIPCKSSLLYPSWFGPEMVNGKNIQYNTAGSSGFNNVQLPLQKRVRLGWSTDFKSLIIRNVTVADEGRYRCSNDTFLSVRVRPSRLKVEQMSVVPVGERVEINCTSSGSKPAANLKWLYKDKSFSGRQVSSFDNETQTYAVTSMLEMTVTADDNSQSAVCIVSHPLVINPVNESVNLNILFSVTKNSTKITGNGVTKEDSSLTLNCTTGSSNPASVIKWFNGSVEIENSQPYKEWSGAHKGAIRSQILVLITSRHMNGNLITCSVYNNGNMTSPVNASARLGIQFRPLTTIITGNNNIFANGKTPLTLDCLSGSSNPVSDITWKVNSVITSATQNMSDEGGEYGGMKRRQKLTLTPTRDNDGDTISCEAKNALGTSNRSENKLDLKYQPIIEPMSDLVAVEGDTSVLTCRASSKPASIFKWYKHGQSTILKEGSGLLGKNELSYAINNVRKEDAATYRCNADNGVGEADDETVFIKVHYPPDVNVIASNTSVKALSITITCNAKGLPNNNYPYGKWVQTWPGYSMPLKEKSGSKVLQLTGLSYEHSGLYTCSASNGIRVFGTNKEFIEGSAIIVIKSFPIIVTQDNTKISAKLNERLNIEMEYYSNAGVVDVKVYKNVNGSRQKGPAFTLSKTIVTVNLPVFKQIVKTKGIKAVISFSVMSKEDVGRFDIVLSNEVDSTVRTIEIIPEGPPGVSKNITVDSIQQTTARVSWTQGYHGGFSQTFLIQLRTDKTQWENVETVYGGMDEREYLRHKILTDLQHSTTYYVRIYAFNSEGNGPFSQYQIFTTLPLAVPVSNQIPVGGIVGGTVSALIIITFTVVIVVLFRRNTITKEGIRTRFQTLLSIIRKQNPGEQHSEMNNIADNNTCERPYQNINNKSNVNKVNTINVYEKLQRSANTENANAYDKIKVEKETTANRGEYENLPKKTCTTDAFKSEIEEKLGKGKTRVYENLKADVKGAKKT